MYKDILDIVMQKEIDFNISIRSSREFQNKTYNKVGAWINFQNGCRQPLMHYKKHIPLFSAMIIDI